MSTNSVIHRFNTEHFSTLHGKTVLLGYSEVIIHVINPNILLLILLV
jgi:hypothetical protein